MTELFALLWAAGFVGALAWLIVDARAVRREPWRRWMSR